MQIAIEYTLNRGWIHDETYEEEVGEKNFTVPGPWLINTIERHWKDIKPDDFLDAYEPEVEGEYIYRLAQRAGVIIDEGYTFNENYDLFVNMLDKKIYFYENAMVNCDEDVDEDDLWMAFADMYEGNMTKLFEMLPDWFEAELRGRAMTNKFDGRYCSIKAWRERGGRDEYLRV